MSLPIRILLAAMFLMLSRPLQVVVVTLVLLVGLAGCAATPAPEPPPAPPIVNLVACSAPVGMTEPEAVPERPTGDYTQRDVALYVQALHRWGSRGWQRLAAVRDDATHCRASVDDNDG